MSPRTYTDAELDAAIDALSDPDRMRESQDLVMRAAPSLQRVLAAAIAEGGWFGDAHKQAIADAIADPDPDARLQAIRTMMADETRLGMLVGVAVGFELARTLEAGDPPGGSPDPEPQQED